MRSKLKPLWLTLGATALALSVGSASAQTPEKFKFALNWFAVGDHAAYWVALEKGYYSKAGLDVTLENSKGSGDSIAKVDTGRADAGLADTVAVFSGLAGHAAALNASGVFFGTPYKAEAAGKSLAVRVNTPGIDPTLPFERERHKVVTSLEAIRSLTDWLVCNRTAISEITLQQKERSRPEEPERIDDLVRYPTEAEFKEQLWATYRECETLGYKPTGMLEMMQRLGAIATAKQLLAKPPSGGFSRLAELGRLDLAIESIALEPRWSSLFSQAELKVARRRLR